MPFNDTRRQPQAMRRRLLPGGLLQGALLSDGVLLQSKNVGSLRERRGPVSPCGPPWHSRQTLRCDCNFCVRSVRQLFGQDIQGVGSIQDGKPISGERRARRRVSQSRPITPCKTLIFVRRTQRTQDLRQFQYRGRGSGPQDFDPADSSLALTAKLDLDTNLAQGWRHAAQPPGQELGTAGPISRPADSCTGRR